MPSFNEPVILPSQSHISDSEGASVGWVKRRLAELGGGGLSIDLSGVLAFALDGYQPPSVGEAIQHNLGTRTPFAVIRQNSMNNVGSNTHLFDDGDYLAATASNILAIDGMGSEVVTMIDVVDENFLYVRYQPFIGSGHILFVTRPLVVEEGVS